MKNLTKCLVVWKVPFLGLIKKITSVPFDQGQNLVESRFITEDATGNIWFGGRYGVLWRYNGNELKDFTQEKRK